MVRDELPGWCAARGFDTGRVALWGWSMGGYGALLPAQAFPGPPAEARRREVGQRGAPGGR